MNLLEGYRTLIGAVLAVGCGMYFVVTGKNVEFGFGLISLGFISFGLGQKIDKINKTGP